VLRVPPLFGELEGGKGLALKAVRGLSFLRFQGRFRKPLLRQTSPGEGHCKTDKAGGSVSFREGRPESYGGRNAHQGLKVKEFTTSKVAGGGVKGTEETRIASGLTGDTRPSRCVPWEGERQRRCKRGQRKKTVRRGEGVNRAGKVLGGPSGRGGGYQWSSARAAS